MSARIHIGTSGWHYSHWRDNFYPAQLKPQEWLHYYAEQLSCVELNNSFYRIPSLHDIESWAGQTPTHFRFAVKAWRGITHRRKLKDCAQFIDNFLAPVQRLGCKLGPLLFQLPPRWRCNSDRLRDFLARLPRHGGLRYAFEFRDPSWHREEVYELLAGHDAAFCIFELGALHSPHIATADFVYVRLHGPTGAYAGAYSAQALRHWATRLHGWRDEGREIWLFFDNDEAGHAVRNALTLRAFVEHGRES